MTKEINKLVGSNLKRLRLLHGLNQNDVAIWLDISLQQISQYERGEASISTTSLAALARLFHVSVGTFFYKGEDGVNSKT